MRMATSISELSMKPVVNEDEHWRRFSLLWSTNFVANQRQQRNSLLQIMGNIALILLQIMGNGAILCCKSVATWG